MSHVNLGDRFIGGPVRCETKKTNLLRVKTWKGSFQLAAFPRFQTKKNRFSVSRGALQLGGTGTDADRAKLWASSQNLTAFCALFSLNYMTPYLKHILHDITNYKFVITNFIRLTAYGSVATPKNITLHLDVVLDTPRALLIVDFHIRNGTRSAT